MVETISEDKLYSLFKMIIEDLDAKTLRMCEKTLKEYPMLSRHNLLVVEASRFTEFLTELEKNNYDLKSVGYLNPGFLSKISISQISGLAYVCQWIQQKEGQYKGMKCKAVLSDAQCGAIYMTCCLAKYTRAALLLSLEASKPSV